LAAVALVLAVLYALTLAPLWGGASSAASTVSALAVDAVSLQPPYTDGGGGGGGGWAAGTRFTCFTSTTVQILTQKNGGGLQRTCKLLQMQSIAMQSIQR